MRILHTADWHIGQLFHGYDRTDEHQQFLNWLVRVLKEEQVEVLLVSGDVFDHSNPSTASVKMFYTFLNEAVKIVPDIQIVITAGNHDSGSRLESPKPLLESSNIHIIGQVKKDAEGTIDYEQLIVPLIHPSKGTKVWCLAVPFLRMGDYPAIPDCSNPYTEGVAEFYKEGLEHILNRRESGKAIIAMGHLHTQNAEITDLDNKERLIMGGIECISATAFHDEIKYVALGHIHKAQRIGGKNHIRYSGSPLPLSFSELNYRHQVILFDLHEDISNLKSVEVPLFVTLMRIPSDHRPLNEVVSLLSQLPLGDGKLAPYLEVRVLLDGPEPSLRHKIEMALADKNVRLAKINPQYPTSTGRTQEFITQEQLNELRPLDVFSKIYRSKYSIDVPEAVMKLYKKVADEVNQKTV